MRSTLIYLCSFFLFACGKDKNQQDYQNQRLQTDLAKYQEVHGQYRGYLTSKDGSKNLGAVQLTLIDRTQVDPSPNNPGNDSKATGHPVLVAGSKFLGNYHTVISGKNSFYDPASGQFTTEIPVQINEGNGKTVDHTIAIDAIVGGGHADGSMKVFEYSNSGGVFHLSTGEKSLEELAGSRKLDFDSSRVPVILSYSGVSVGTSISATRGHTVPVTLTVSSPPLDRFTEIYYLLFATSEKVLQVNLKSGSSLVANFPSTWDVANKTLNGQTTLQVGPNSGVISLSCTSFSFEANDVFTCDYTSTLNNSTLQFKFPAK